MFNQQMTSKERTVLHYLCDELVKVQPSEYPRLFAMCAPGEEQSKDYHQIWNSITTASDAIAVANAWKLTQLPVPKQKS